jgi:membrane protein YqaA with SNARE-associated domain
MKPINKKDRKKDGTSRSADVIAFLWGLAEATFFFVIPDMFTSYRALKSWRSGFRACLLALAGALAGGSLIYAYAAWKPAAALRAVDSVPAVTVQVIQTARQSYDKDGAAAIFYGPAKTVPYKVYTVMAPSRHIGYLEFMAISAPARMARFVAVTAAAAGLSYLLRNRLSMRIRLVIYGLCWCTMYILYFAHHWI